MTRSPIILAAAVAAFAALPAGAADILGDCAEDIQTYCSAVEPGHGRVAACLYAHEDKVSESCDLALGETADIIDMMFERLRAVKTACGEDIRSQCGEVELGEGRIFACLIEKKAEISADCGELVGKIQLPQDG